MRVAERDQVRLYFRLYPDEHINAEYVIAFLREPPQHLGRVCLLWDHLQAYRACLTQDYLRNTPVIRATDFPGYASELNPMEYGWSRLTTNPLANMAVLNFDTLTHPVRRHSRSLQHQ